MGVSDKLVLVRCDRVFYALPITHHPSPNTTHSYCAVVGVWCDGSGDGGGAEFAFRAFILDSPHSFLSRVHRERLFKYLYAYSIHVRKHTFSQ